MKNTQLVLRFLYISVSVLCARPQLLRVLSYIIPLLCHYSHECSQGSLVPRLHSPAFLAPCRKAGREPGIFHHVLRDVGCVVWCVVLLIELRVTFIVVHVVRVVSR